MRFGASKGRLALALGVVILIAAMGGVVAARGGDEPSIPRGDALIDEVNKGIAADPGKMEALGQLRPVQKGVFHRSQGQLVDVDLLAGKGGIRCLSVSGDLYSSSISCFDQRDAAKSGSYQVVIPLLDNAPVVVVGVAPNGKSRVQATAAGTQARGVMRGQMFVTNLEPGALGENNAAPVSVSFEN